MIDETKLVDWLEGEKVEVITGKGLSIVASVRNATIKEIIKKIKSGEFDVKDK